MGGEVWAMVSVGRREFLRGTGAVAVSAMWGGLGEALGQAGGTTDRLTQMRAAAGAAKVTVEVLRGNVSWITGGPFGNIAVLTGPDGKLVVDSAYSTVRPQLEAALARIDGNPLKTLVNTHWHIDHTDGNEWMHAAGATIVAQTNTRKRLSTPQDMTVLGMHFDPAPEGAWPVTTFDEELKLHANGTTVALRHYEPAHTDCDCSVVFAEANVVHMGDTYFASGYPLIDASSGGRIGGMVAAVQRTLAGVDAETKIIPGHGPLGNRATLTEYGDMLASIQGRVAELKRAGKSVAEAVAMKPTASFDGKWAKGFIPPDMFVGLVYAGV